jgi:hypothetical protein
MYVQHGGQPGHRGAWTDPEADRLTGGFFSSLLPVMGRDGYYLQRQYFFIQSFQPSLMNLPLKGLLVLEFSHYLSGPSAGLRLADMGARVIKVERPGSGEAGRRLAIKNLWQGDDSLLFHTINRNKESITADSVAGGRLLQTERDWIWYAAWSRYAWRSKREVHDEDAYWAARLADRFGCNLSDGYRLLAAYEHSGRIAPMLLRRFGITDGNRQTLTLGMLMTQLINPYRYGLFTLLYECEAPEGESLSEYADRDWKGLPHAGETPAVVNATVLGDADAAVTSIDGLT